MEALGDWIGKTTGSPFTVRNARVIGGGCINRCYRVESETSVYFIKCNTPDKLPSLRAEFVGLQQLRATATIIVPKPLAVGTVEKQAVLAMEHLNLTAARNDDDWRRAGVALAQLHESPIHNINKQMATDDRETHLPTEGFGCRLSNATLGDRPGFVAEHPDWAEFFCEHRLAFQFRQSLDLHGTRFTVAEQILQHAHRRLSHRPPPSLTHGDLWGGNAAFAHINDEVRPVFYDPAPYLADAETDLAMSQLFGGFHRAFYEGYQSVRPIDPDYPLRRPLYDLYHILNHYNLFGGGYRQQAEALMRQILSTG